MRGPGLPPPAPFLLGGGREGRRCCRHGRVPGGGGRGGLDRVVPVAGFGGLEAWAAGEVRGWGGRRRPGAVRAFGAGARRAPEPSRADPWQCGRPTAGERGAVSPPARAVRCGRGGARVAARAGQPRPGALTGKFLELLRTGGGIKRARLGCWHRALPLPRPGGMVAQRLVLATRTAARSVGTRVALP